MEGNKIKFILINFIYIIVTIFVLISCKDGSSGSSSNSSEKNNDSSSGPVYDNNPLSTLNEGLALEIVTYLFDAFFFLRSVLNSSFLERAIILLLINLTRNC